MKCIDDGSGGGGGTSKKQKEKKKKKIIINCRPLIEWNIYVECSARSQDDIYSFHTCIHIHMCNKNSARSLVFIVAIDYAQRSACNVCAEKGIVYLCIDSVVGSRQWSSMHTRVYCFAEGKTQTVLVSPTTLDCNRLASLSLSNLPACE